MAELERLLASGIDDVLLLYYPRDWRAGESIWTPVASRHAAVMDRYRSAAAVTSEPVTRLASSIEACEPCMMFVLADASHDALMAYQHARPHQFVMAPGIDKAVGARAAADLVGFDPGANLG